MIRVPHQRRSSVSHLPLDLLTAFKFFSSKISRRGVRANAGAKLGNRVGGWEKFWPKDRGPVLSRAEWITDPWIRPSLQGTSRNTHFTPLCVCGSDSERHRETSTSDHQPFLARLLARRWLADV